jgi:hypothetical protein
MFLKKLFLASASVLMLALAYHLGASTATAQAPSNPVVAVFPNYSVVTANGDLYANLNGTVSGPFQLVGNVFNGASPVPTRTQSWGSVKVQQR